jgi:hypothetical protein
MFSQWGRLPRPHMTKPKRAPAFSVSYRKLNMGPASQRVISVSQSRSRTFKTLRPGARSSWHKFRKLGPFFWILGPGPRIPNRGSRTPEHRAGFISLAICAPPPLGAETPNRVT